MLKNCFLPVNYNNQTSHTCGEIICENLDEFIINCKLCKLKIFEFGEFIQHFKNVHLYGTNENKSNELEDNGQEKYKGKEPGTINFKTTESQYEPIKSEMMENENVEFLWKTDSNDDFNDYNDDDETSEYDDEEEADEEESEVIMRKFRKPKEFSCKICSKKYADSRRLQVHVTLAHLRKKPFKCSTCDMAFTEEPLLQNHISSKHTGFECSKCHKKFRTKQNLQRHTLIHLDKKDFVCDEDNCGKAFVTKGQLKKHQFIHSSEMFICEECGYKCRKRESLVVHKRHHTGEKPFGCQLCDSSFVSKSLLSEHMASHETERKHVCDVCGKSFNRPKALYHHKHLHLGVKKFVCKICGQAYAQAAGLSAHTRKHREDLASFITDTPLSNNANKIK